MSRIELDESNLYARVNDLSQASKNIEVQTLSPLDETSTITANEKGRQAFQDAQSSHQVLSAALLHSSELIKGVGDAFFKIEEYAAISWANIY